MQTIADELGVSKQTVSNAFNRPDQLSPALRARVLEHAEQLGYPGPDPSARALASGRTGVVGVVLTERSADALADPAASEFLIGVAGALERRGANLLLIAGRPDGADDHDVSSPVFDAAVDGFVLYSLGPSDPHLSEVLARRLPVVTVDQPELAGHAHVGIDQREATRAVTAHLVQLGHTEVAVLCLRARRDGRSGPIDGPRRCEVEFPLTEQRLAGIDDAGVGVAATWECPDRSAVVDAVDHVLDRTAATAIVAMSDELASAAIERLGERGVAVPSQMSVVGVDDVPMAERSGLTTYRQDHRAKGRAAIDLLLDGTTAEELRPGLVIRSSTTEQRD